MSLGGGSSSGRQGVQFFPGQEALTGEIFDQILRPRILGGTPTPAGQRQVQRAQTGVQRQFAQRGLSGSGLEAKAISDAAVGSTRVFEDEMANLLATALNPAGQFGRSRSKNASANVGGAFGAPG